MKKSTALRGGLASRDWTNGDYGEATRRRCVKERSKKTDRSDRESACAVHQTSGDLRLSRTVARIRDWRISDQRMVFSGGGGGSGVNVRRCICSGGAGSEVTRSSGASKGGEGQASLQDGDAVPGTTRATSSSDGPDVQTAAAESDGDEDKKKKRTSGADDAAGAVS
ncbi:hypothetical protein Scep_011433 [Stephania cephalantha]|uniref:Uncharacterized protein n=1 Tax=Stephania cephalantha TaxID=152367 RepID=A0AAP0P8A7_9MAGN